MKSIFKLAKICTLLGALAACGGGAGVSAGSGSAPSPAPVSAAPADINVLMFGNSHSAANGLPLMLAAMLRAGRPGKSVNVALAPGFQFLDERLTDATSLQLFNSLNWNAVILQAQKYSESGLFTYSTKEAVEWIKMSSAKHAIPLMFPEWPRLSIDETERIFALHVGIAQQQAACVAPIPQAFDLAAQRIPGVELYAADGNHSATAGAFLAALILYATLTSSNPVELPYFSAVEVKADIQQKLRAVAEEQVGLLSPRTYCPNEGKL